MKSKTNPAGKTIDMTVEINADPEEVWKAISEAEGLERWFPLQAKVDQGIGGSMTWSWGPGCEGTSRIEQWEEGRKIRLVEGPGKPDAAPVIIEFLIEGRGGKTILRLVNSGFDPGPDWAEYVDTVHSGWQYFLWNLKLYLERHKGTPRRMVWQRCKLSLPKADLWRRILASGGLAATAMPATEGAAVTLWSGHAGVVKHLMAPIHLAAHFPSLNDAALLIELEPGDSYHLGIWLSLYGVEEDRVQEIESSLAVIVGSLADG